MEAAFIAPTNLLDSIQEYSRYHLVLTHKVIYEKRYCDFYKERSRRGDYIMLDNSAVEKNGRSVPMKEVTLAAMLIKPTIVFLPDSLFDAESTLDGIENALRSRYVRALRHYIKDIKLAVVIQGLDKDEWLECFEILNGIRGIDMLGIPMISTKLFGSRTQCLELIAGRVKHPCHLLGAMDSLEDTTAQAKFRFVKGVDTSKPVRLAAAGMRLEQWSEIKRDPSFIDRTCHHIDKDLLNYNCAKFVELCAQGGNGNTV